MANTPITAVGLDVGGTKIAGGVVNFPSGEVLVRRVIPTAAERDGERVLKDCLDFAADLIREASSLDVEVKAVGVGVPELVDLEGNITSGHAVKWRGLPVQESFSKLAPAVVESDGRAAALAESLLGAGKPFRLFVYVTVGTGISHCLVQEDRPYAGARGNALIFASSPFTNTCTGCGTVLKPVLEDFAAGPALVARYNQLSQRKTTRAEEVISAADAGDSAAAQVVRSAGEALGVSVALLINTLDPQAVIVGGGLGLVDGLYWSSFVGSTRDHIWSEDSRDLPVLRAALGTDAGLIGAAATAVRKIPESGSPARAPAQR